MLTHKTSERGQSTIEFIFAFAFGVSLIFMVFNSAINQATGYLVHYATFMASRVYLTADSNLGTVASPLVSLSGSEAKARSTFEQYNLGIFNLKDLTFTVNQTGSVASDEYLTVGTTTSFRMKVDVLGKIAGETELNMVSESFLGKEPTRAVCASRVCFALTGQTSCSTNMDITLYDDGC